MFAHLELFLTTYLGPAQSVGASSWLQAFTWLATLVAAFIAGIALRRNSLQSRATLILNLHRSWESLEENRRAFVEFFNEIRHDVVNNNPRFKEPDQRDLMRKAFQVKLAELRDGRDPKFSQFISYLAFFEVVGMYVKNGYVPIRDVVQVYKGPILSLEIAWRDFIKVWEKEAHIPKGLLEHANFLMAMTAHRNYRPVFYWAVYRFRRYI